MLELRDYQVEALADTWAYFQKPNPGNPLVVLPTGSGKSLVSAEWDRGCLIMDPRARILNITHVRELVAQNHAELVGLWPEAPAGIYSAGLKKRQLGSRILFGSIQSLHKKALQVQQCDILKIDEAHLVPRSADTMYGRFIKELKAINPQMKIIGLTATPFRLDDGLLYGGDSIFTDIAHETSPRLLIEQGYLVPLVGRTRQEQSINLQNVHTRLGEFVASELEERAIDPETVEKMADDMVANAMDRRGWLFFGVSIKHCEMMADALRARGIVTATISANTPDDEREQIINAYKRMEIRCLSSMGVLTTGFNAKHVDFIALGRPTKSTGLYIQMVGRGTRCLGKDIHESRANGKANCLVFDYGGNIRRHGPFDDPFAPSARKGEKGAGVMPLKECEECGNEVAIATRYCPVCGFEFPPIEHKVSTAADFAPILAPPPEWTAVDAVTYAKHASRDPMKPGTLKVSYRCGMTFHHEWVCFDHPARSYARQKAARWWATRAAVSRGGQPPASVSEALERANAGDLSVPVAIQVERDGKWTKVRAYRWSENDDVSAMPPPSAGLWLPKAAA